MRTNLFFYSFDTKSKPGKVLAHGIRFETLEVDAENFKETAFKILCPDHGELRPVPLKTFAGVVKENFRKL